MKGHIITTTYNGELVEVMPDGTAYSIAEGVCLGKLPAAKLVSIYALARYEESKADKIRAHGLGVQL